MPAQTAFAEAAAIVIGTEAGLSIDRLDPGNWTGPKCTGACNGTKFGISANAYPKLNIAGLTLAAAEAIYQRDYWAAVRGDELPPPLALIVFDSAVNSGVGQAIKWLQNVVAVQEDGDFGKVTMAALNKSVTIDGINAIVTEYLVQRLMMLTKDVMFPHDGLGWTRRIIRLPYQSLTMSVPIS